MCYDVSIEEEGVLSDGLNFYIMLSKFLLSLVSESEEKYVNLDTFFPSMKLLLFSLTLPLPDNVSEIFASLPEYYVENLPEFLSFVVQ